MAAALELGAVWILAALLALVVLAAAGIAIRRILLERGGGTVECGLRLSPGQGWRLGLASYQPAELRWYDAFGVLLRPRAVFARGALSVESRRPADAWESASLGQGMVVVECRTAECGPVELAMGEAALTGFLAWLESAPPGRGNSPR
ncbi:MAG TPA: DUF2550 domain-containing protein [Streptosporangiaceae bacterium]